MADIYGGTATGPQTEAGVPLDIWNTWTDQTQEMFLEDYYRTDAQKNYVDIWASDWRNATAYVYTGYIDLALGTDAAEVGETTNQAYDTFREASQASLEDLQNTSKEFLFLGVLAWAITR